MFKSPSPFRSGTPPGVRKGDSVFTPQVGFTLVEVLTVLAVAGILMLIVVPRIDVERFQLDSAMREVGSAVAAARGGAILRQYDHVLIFTDDGFVVLHDENNDGSWDAGEERRTVQLSERVRFGRGGAEPILGLTEAITFAKRTGQFPVLTFHRNGAASEEGIIYLTSVRAAGGSSNAEDTRALQIERATGRVRCFTYRTVAWQEGC